MSYLYRCKKTFKSGPLKGQQCNTRNRLRKKLADYVNPPRCKCCKQTLSYEDKWQRKKNRDPSNLCQCDGIWFVMRGSPHRKGSKWCNHYEGEYTEDELQERYAR